jgi:hypothetical protein
MSKHLTWADRRMITLERSHEFESTEAYYNYIETSFYNGQRKQTIKLFKDMPKYYRKHFLSYLADQVEGHNANNCDYYELLKLLIEHI